MQQLASDKVDNFIESLNLPSIASVLLDDEEDCHIFFENFYMRNKYVLDDILDFRDYKIGKSQKTLDEFKEMCYTLDMRFAFESTFYQSFTADDIDLIAEAILKGAISLESLFNGFKKNPDKNIMKYVL